MAVHLNIIKPLPDYGRDYWPGWFCPPNGGHKQFAREVYGDLPRVYYEGPGVDEFETLSRPADFAVWRKAIIDSNLPNQSLFAEMVDILEANPDYWLYISQ